MSNLEYELISNRHRRQSMLALLVATAYAARVKGVPDMSEVTRILSAIEQGDPKAAEKLLPLVYDELRKLAAARTEPRSTRPVLAATSPHRRPRNPSPSRARFPSVPSRRRKACGRRRGPRP